MLTSFPAWWKPPWWRSPARCWASACTPSWSPRAGAQRRGPEPAFCAELLADYKVPESVTLGRPASAQRQRQALEARPARGARGIGCRSTTVASGASSLDCRAETGRRCSRSAGRKPGARRGRSSRARDCRRRCDGAANRPGALNVIDERLADAVPRGGACPRGPGRPRGRAAERGPRLLRTATMDDFDHILNWKLKAGSHPFPGKVGGTCINEAALVAAGFEYRPVPPGRGPNASAENEFGRPETGARSELLPGGARRN